LRTGRPRKPLAQHVMRGTYRRDRHGELPAHVHPIGSGTSTAWMPDRAQLDAQGAAGRAFVEQMVAANELNDREGAIVLELGHVKTALAAVRAVTRDGLSLKECAVRDRIELGWVRAFASLMAMLKVTA
jgi:hypothetical protein